MVSGDVVAMVFTALLNGVVGEGAQDSFKTVEFKLEPNLFEQWDDDHAFARSAKVDTAGTCPKGTLCAAGNAESDSGVACPHCGKPDSQTKEKLNQVRQYYNSKRTIDLIRNPETLPRYSFHSPFMVGKVDDNVYLAQLAKLPLGEPLDRQTPYVRVLDFGCGLGRFASTIAMMCSRCEVHGVNIAEAQIEIARDLTPENNVAFSAYDGIRLPYENSSFDVIVFQESYSFHTPNQRDIAMEFARVLRPGGHLAGLDWFTAPGLTDAEYMHWIGPINVAWEASTGSPESVARCLRSAGFRDVEFIDTAHLEGVHDRPRDQFLDGEARRQMVDKYGGLRAQLSLSSFAEAHRHVYALEAMSLAIENHMYWEGFVTATKP